MSKNLKVTDIILEFSVGGGSAPGFHYVQALYRPVGSQPGVMHYWDSDVEPPGLYDKILPPGFKSHRQLHRMDFGAPKKGDPPIPWGWKVPRRVRITVEDISKEAREKGESG